MKKRTHYSIRKTKWGTASLALGTSLLLATANVATVLADTTLTPDEQTKLDTFLGTQPSDREQVNLGKASLVPTPPINYTFPGIDNYTSFMLTGKTKKLPFNDVELYDPILNTDRPAIIKDVDSIDAYEFKASFGGEEYYFVKKATLVFQDDNSELEVENALVYDGYYGNSLTENVFQFDVPIEEADPRFEKYSNSGALLDGNYRLDSYWNFSVLLDEIAPYETIVTIDENLKTGEIVEDTAGSNRDVRLKFKVDYTFDESNYKQFTSDRIYNDVVATYGNAIAAADKIKDGILANTATFDWGTTTVDGNGSHDWSAQNRQLRVGIDYTNFIKEDGTELAPKEYGLQESKTFTGYTLAETRSETNGDRTYVYKVTPPSSSSSSSSTTTPGSSDSGAPSGTDVAAPNKRSTVLPSTGVVSSVGVAVLGLGILAGILTWRSKEQKRSK